MGTQEDSQKAKIAALKHLQQMDFYEPKMDNPEGLDLDGDTRTPQQAAQATNIPPNPSSFNVNPVVQALPSPSPNTLNPGQPSALQNVVSGKSREQQLQDLLDQAK